MEIGDDLQRQRLVLAVIEEYLFSSYRFFLIAYSKGTGGRG
jgi:hypothetical protein